MPAARNIPFDIDEMPAILAQEDKSHNPFDNGPMGFGRFESGEPQEGPLSSSLVDPRDIICSAARRSDDPGVIEWRSLAKPPSPCLYQGRNNESLRLLGTKRHDQFTEDLVAFGDTENADSLIRGEVSLRCFEEVQRRKRRKLCQSMQCTRRRLISVKVGSSSTRASVLPEFPETDNGPRKSSRSILAATLPTHIQTGKILSAAKSKTLDQELGSYSASSSGKNSSRAPVGRTRLVWTEKRQSEQPQRSYFASFLTGEKLDSGSQKRPRDVRVSVTLHGKPLQPADELHKPSTPSLSLMRGDRCVANRNATHGMPGKHNRKLQCTLDPDALVNNLLLDAAKDHDVNGKSFESVAVVAPRIDCLPDSNGFIGVVCSVPGRFTQTSSVSMFLNDGARKPKLKCSICWSSGKAGSIIEECCTCGVTVHLGCCYDTGNRVKLKPAKGGSEDSKSKWQCAVCNTARIMGAGTDYWGGVDGGKSRKPSQLPERIRKILSASVVSRTSGTSPHDGSRGFKCELCPHSGGAMSPFDLDGETVWIHEVCRIWCMGFGTTEHDIQRDADFGVQYEKTCALCGTFVESSTRIKSNLGGTEASSAGLAKCVAARCQVHFHPMCARLASLLSKVDHKVREGNQKTATQGHVEDEMTLARKIDVHLCTQYTLTAAKCVAVEGAKGRDPGMECFSSVPVAFCGIHNPKRDPSFFGMYPGGQHLDGSIMRVPPQD